MSRVLLPSAAVMRSTISAAMSWPPFRYPVVLHQIGDVAAQNLSAVRDCDSGEVGADAEHRLAAEPRHVVGNPPVADHAPHDMQGCTQQMLQLVDACLEIVVEP